MCRVSVSCTAHALLKDLLTAQSPASLLGRLDTDGRVGAHVCKHVVNRKRSGKSWEMLLSSLPPLTKITTVLNGDVPLTQVALFVLKILCTSTVVKHCYLFLDDSTV